jgi:uncharacterized membrane protein
MIFDFTEWANLAFRMLHLTAGIAWIGSSFYFVWLDSHLTPPKNGTANGELWSVHGGGFYHKQKYQVAPEQMPENLHWFKWEAYFTWISGFSLLILIYYVGAQNNLVDATKAPMSAIAAIAIGLSALIAGWLFYHLLCQSPLGRNERALGAIWFGFLIIAAWLLDSIFNARGAYIHVGAMMGTAMAANVFFVIIPNQRKVVAALIAGETPDPSLGKAAKQRSVHNNYMTLPVLFIMMSHHYPMTYGAERPWLVLALLGLSGVAIRHIFNLRHTGQPADKAMVVAVALTLISIGYVASEKFESAKNKAVLASTTLGEANAVQWNTVSPIFKEHCVSCHAQNPSDPAFATPPLGVKLDGFDDAKAAASRVKMVAVDAEIMPMGNPTAMTAEERALIGQWIDQGTQP